MLAVFVPMSFSCSHLSCVMWQFLGIMGGREKGVEGGRLN